LSPFGLIDKIIVKQCRAFVNEKIFDTNPSVTDEFKVAAGFPPRRVAEETTCAWDAT
jgi:hypothetical protein